MLKILGGVQEGVQYCGQKTVKQPKVPGMEINIRMCLKINLEVTIRIIVFEIYVQKYSLVTAELGKSAHLFSVVPMGFDLPLQSTSLHLIELEFVQKFLGCWR